MASRMSRFRVWWCKTFHKYDGYWWGWTPSGSHFYCCRCNRELFTDRAADNGSAER